ncbi:MAG TPA: DMT family transporter, partial [Acetobacteraceae bacterium]
MRVSRMTPANLSLLELYAATILMGGAPLFAKLVPVSADVLTMLRSAIGAVALGLFIKVLGTKLSLRKRKDYLVIGVIGGVMALHWITYIHAIRVSTVAAALIGFFTFPVLTALMEPLFFYGNGFTYKDILSGIGIFAGALILAMGADTGTNIGQGLLWGMISAILFVLRSMLLKKYMS